MKIGEWDSLGRVRALLQRQLGELGADEDATYVTGTPESGKQRILVATDVGLLEYSWASTTPDPSSPWMLRGTVYRWSVVRGLRLQTDAQLDTDEGEPRSLWRLVAEDPRLELAADTVTGGREGVASLLAFARACLQRIG